MSQQKETPISEQPESGVEEKAPLSPIIPDTIAGVKMGLDYLIETFKKRKAEQDRICAPYERELKGLKLDIEAHLIALGERSYKCEAGHTYIVERTAVRYDATALDAIAKSFPVVKEQIWPHRSETTSRSLTVR